MQILEIEGKSYEVDDEGYLLVFEQWGENFAVHSAEKDGIELTEEHWRLILWYREFFEKYRFTIGIKGLIKEINKVFGPEIGSTKHLWEIFIERPATRLAKYAGLPNPTG